jgi:hypothetical protein
MKSVGRPMKVEVILTVVVLSLYAAGAWAHDWYTSLKQPGNGKSCCGDKDCHRLALEDERLDHGRLQILIDEKWRDVDPGIVLNTRSPDGYLHACWVYDFYFHNPVLLCVILPPES